VIGQTYFSMSWERESMDGIERCLTQIEAIREVSRGEATPYVARSRIGRLAQSLTTLIAKEAGLREPEFAGSLLVPAGAPDALLDLAQRCNTIAELSRHIAQPSEPLAGRWEAGWTELLRELSQLEARLRLASWSSSAER
jgi:hypothetical protein